MEISGTSGPKQPSPQENPYTKVADELSYLHDVFGGGEPSTIPINQIQALKATLDQNPSIFSKKQIKDGDAFCNYFLQHHDQINDPNILNTMKEKFVQVWNDFGQPS